MSNVSRRAPARAALLLLVSAAVAPGCVPTSEAPAVAVGAAREPLVGKLAFRRVAIGAAPITADIWVMNADGSHPRRVTCNTRNDMGAAWSPGGETIAFHVQIGRVGTTPPRQELYLIDGDGPCGPGTFVAEGRFPRWSPDGLKLVFDRGSEGTRNVFVRELSSGTELQLTEDAADRNTRADWSPDGSDRIAFASARGCACWDAAVECGEDDLDIWVMNADGASPTRLTFECSVPGSGANAPRWSPDGKRIVFQSNRDGAPFFEEVYVMDADGANQMRLTFFEGGDASPDWSPNGKRIAFHHCVDGGPAPCTGGAQLYSVSADGTDPSLGAPLTDLALSNGFPDWGGGHVEPPDADLE